MATKLGRKEMPSGYGVDDFTYQGRPAIEQDDVGSEVGIADMVCVDQLGSDNKNKYYHAGVVSANGAWFVYLEWGRISGGKSWNGSFQGQDFQFVQCNGEADARAFFEKQCRSKNMKRLQKKKVGKTEIWVGKNGKDGYVIQKLAVRERGLPDAYGIKDDTGLAKKKAAKKTAKKKSKSKKKIDAQPQVIALAKSLVGGTVDYARAAAAKSGVTPTMDSIVTVRDELIPEALEILKKIGTDPDPDKLLAKQLKSKKLQDLSTYVATIVPRPIPRSGDASAVILSSNNILLVQQDLDAFEAALLNEDFEAEIQEDNQVDPNKVLGRNLTWIDPKSDLGKYVEATYLGMSNNRHGHLSGKFKVLNMFAVEDVAKRKAFMDRAKAIAKSRKGTKHNRAGLQPKKRIDIQDIADWYGDANICIGIHGTRAVNVQPILSSDLRLPKSLKGVHITGAAFGHGIYFATDIKKSHGYVGGGYYGGGGTIKSRGFFMFMCDLTVGKAHMATDTMWTTTNCPRGTDSIFAATGRRNSMSLGNDEHVIFDPKQQFIRYVIEARVGR
jgi:hypothetical protein